MESHFGEHSKLKVSIADFRYWGRKREVVGQEEISDFRFQISDFRFQISDFRFQISDFAGIAFALCKLQSAICNL